MDLLFQPKKKMSKEEWINFIFSLMYLLVVIGILVLIGLGIWGSIFGEPTSNASESTFEVILAGITITLASSIILPKVLLRNEVEASLQTMKRELIEEFRREELPKFLTDTLVLDGHISRMIGTLLLSSKDEEHKSEYMYNIIWSLSWSIRAYKKYIKASQGQTVTGEDVTLENYHDLVLIIDENSKMCYHLLLEEVEKHSSVVGFRDLLLALENIETIERNKALFYRIIKEAVDIEYEVKFEWIKKGRRPKLSHDSEKQIKAWVTTVSPVIALLIGTIYSYLQKDSLSTVDVKAELTSQVVRRSNFGSNGEFKKVFEHSLESISAIVNGQKWYVKDLKDRDRILVHPTN